MNDHLKLLVSDYIAPLLKKEGFTKHGLVWNRKRDSGVAVFDVQVSEWDTNSFTFNLGVAVFEVWNIIWDTPATKIIKEADCFPRFRIGYFLAGGKRLWNDIWYSLEGVEDLPTFGQNIQEVIRTHCIPFLRKCKYPDEIFRMYDIPEMWTYPAERVSYAISRYLVGDIDRGLGILNDMAKDKKLSYWYEVIEKVPGRLLAKGNAQK